jgi:hypothetical protein
MLDVILVSWPRFPDVILVSWPGSAEVFVCYILFWFLGQDSLRFFYVICYSDYLVRILWGSSILGAILVSWTG